MAVTDTLTRAREAAASRPPGRGSVVVSAVTGAIGAAALGLLASLSCVLLGWATDSHSSGSAGSILRAGSQLWVVAHRTPVRLPAGQFVLAPLGLTLLLLAFVARAAAAAVRRTSGGSRADGVVAGLAVAPPYAMVVTVVAGLSATPTVRPAPVAALLASLGLAAGAAVAGILRARGWAEMSKPLPTAARAVIPAAGAAVAAIVATGAVLTAAALVADVALASRLSQTVASGAPTGAALALLQLTLIPNAVVWGSGYALGPGFSVGVGTVVAPLGVQLGPVPALPLLAALPESGGAPALSLLSLAGPLVAGGVAGVVLARRLHAPSPERAAAWAVPVGLAAALGMAALAWSAGGAAPGRLGELGPSPVLTGAAAGAWVVLGAAPTSWWVARRRARR
jgi:hypothetical protein